MNAVSNSRETGREMSDPRAVAIYQAHTDQVTDAFWTRDFTPIPDLMLLPASQVMKDAFVTISDYAALRQLFDDQRLGLDRLGATAYHRICDWAYFEGPDRIKGSHTSYVLRSGTYVLSPYYAQQTLIRGARGTWRAKGIRTELRNADIGAIGPKLLARLNQRSAAQEQKGASDAKD
jgi:hypothetical protein